ncbi:MAG TPA: hypothetical protein VFL84_02885 [Gammaproteobacteria bacterium]|nr:hypothetical protein [Gammaproteobacteria bacterium]
MVSVFVSRASTSGVSCVFEGAIEPGPRLLAALRRRRAEIPYAARSDSFRRLVNGWHTFCFFFGMDVTNVLDGRNKWPNRLGKIPGMPLPATSEANLRELRMRYNAAYSAYQSCLIAINEAAMSGLPPSKALLANEGNALRELNDARGNLIAAMGQITWPS